VKNKKVFIAVATRTVVRNKVQNYIRYNC